MEKLSYALGMVIGHNLKGMGVKGLDAAQFGQAASAVIEGSATTLTDAEAQQLVSDFVQRQQAEAGKAVREDGERFLAENAKKEGVTVLPSGLQYTVIKEGNGSKPKATDKVKCHYEGTLPNGTVFDSSYRRGEPAVALPTVLPLRPPQSACRVRHRRRVNSPCRIRRRARRRLHEDLTRPRRDGAGGGVRRAVAGEGRR